MQRVGLEFGHAAKVERIGQFGPAEDEIAREVLLVVLQHERHGARVDAVFGEVRVQILKALDVLLELARLAVGHEHDAVGALKHELARRLVVDLPGHGVELELGREAGDRAEIERQEVEEQRAIRLRRERDHLPFPIIGNLPVDVMQIRRLSGPTRPVVDDFARDLAGGVVDERQSGKRKR